MEKKIAPLPDEKSEIKTSERKAVTIDNMGANKLICVTYLLCINADCNTHSMYNDDHVSDKYIYSHSLFAHRQSRSTAIAAGNDIKLVLRYQICVFPNHWLGE